MQPDYCPPSTSPLATWRGRLFSSTLTFGYLVDLAPRSPRPFPRPRALLLCQHREPRGPIVMSARSVAASYKPPMLVPRARLPACAFMFFRSTGIEAETFCATHCFEQQASCGTRCFVQQWLYIKHLHELRQTAIVKILSTSAVV